MNPDGAGDSGSELLVTRQENPILGTNAFDEGSIRSRFGIRRVVAHEAQPACETSEHVIAEELHTMPFEITRISKRRARLFPARSLGSANAGFHPSPPRPADPAKSRPPGTPRWRAPAPTAP